MAALAGQQNSDLYESTVVNKGVPKVRAQDVYGKVRYVAASFDSGTDTLGTTALLKMFQLPKGAKVIDMALTSPDLGSTGDLDVGWGASTETDEDGTVLEAADPDGFWADLDVNAAALERTRLASSAHGFHKRFNAAVDVEITVPEATTAAGEILLECWYVVE